MNFLKTSLVLVGLFFTTVSYTKDVQQIKPARKLVELVLGSDLEEIQFALQSIAMQRKDLGQKHRDILVLVLKQVFIEHIEELLARMVALYEQYFTDTELREILVFYETAAGQKYLNNMAVVAIEGQKLAAEWGVSLRAKLNQKTQQVFKENGLEPINL